MLFVPPGIPFMAPEVEAQSPPTLTADAYVNGTSSTGRTIHFDVLNPAITDSANTQRFDHITVTKDGSEVFFHDPIRSLRMYEEANSYRNDYSQISIPIYWEAGTYDINWQFYYTGDTGVTTVTIPQLPSGYLPTATMTAYLNATSPTGRTLHFAESLNPTFHSFGLTISKDGSVVSEQFNSFWGGGWVFV